MKQLTISLTGEINRSNFDEWKIDLIEQIRATKMELVSDNDFATATEKVKLFKSAENALKNAKQAAIEQATDIQNLFAAIDEVSEETRQARLSLDRQIKSRKMEIKQDFIRSGIDTITRFMDQQSNDFQAIDPTSYISHARFESAVTGKASTKGMQTAIDSLCETIKQEISVKAVEVAKKASVLDALPSGYQLLFQDRGALLDLPKQELDLTVDKRIAKFEEENSRATAQQAANKLEQLEKTELNPELAKQYDNSPAEQQKFKIVIDILSSKETAMELARSIKESYSDRVSITEISLSRDHS
ncbi:hypothetical protein [Candidatus Marimicrobium litorale]|uniref:Uncharacterized protein n=1 Tax=Candidatus Marimicrobium litorale TaxID=2518991 RepID=A0ABT3TAG7_9GAMM|nr:hypothetical protein [Candidatus Marimicrobium litorale]MCX2979240.1 hypothetical protein [Candidatus Marimicrobium litorale]